MTDLRKAAEMALEALENVYGKGKRCEAAIKELRQALAQPEQEPVAWFIQYEDSHEFVWSKPDGWRVKQALEIQPLYTAPPKREWVGLTDEEIYDYADKFLYQHGSNYGIKSFGKAIEAKLKEKNGG